MTRRWELSSEEGLGALCLFILEKSKPQGDFSIFSGASRKVGDISFSRANCKRTRGNGFKLKDTQFRLALRKKLFVRRVLEHWHRLPRELGGAPSPATFKLRLDGPLNNLIYLKMSLPVAGVLG